jgi:hypothetical protein
MNPTPQSRHCQNHHTDTYGTHSRSNEQRVNTIATPPGLVPVPAVRPANEGGR